MRHYCARGTSNGNVLLYKSPFFAWIILNDSTTVYINLATNLPAVSFLFYSLLGTLWNSQRMVNIITLSLCSLNTQNGREETEQKKFWEANLLSMSPYIQPFAPDVMYEQSSLAL